MYISFYIYNNHGEEKTERFSYKDGMKAVVTDKLPCY